VGAVYKHDLQNARRLTKSLSVGDTICGKVVESENEDGYVELSVAEAGRQKAWAEALELQGREEVVRFTIRACNKGGLTGELYGLTAFLPLSQLSAEHYTQTVGADKTRVMQALQKLIGEECMVKIIEVNQKANKFIVSEKAAHELGVRELVKNYTVGQVVEGVVIGIADFGAFIRFTDNPGLEGLIHISELDHRLLDAKDMVAIDDVVKAQITEIKDGKILLSRKALQEDPWVKTEEWYRVGDRVMGTVYRFHSFGALINLDHDLQGQVHVSDFGGGEEMKQKLAQGKAYPFAVQSVSPADRRIILKLAEQITE